MRTRGIGRKGKTCPVCRRIMFWDPVHSVWYCHACDEYQEDGGSAQHEDDKYYPPYN